MKHLSASAKLLQSVLHRKHWATLYTADDFASQCNVSFSHPFKQMGGGGVWLWDHKLLADECVVLYRSSVTKIYKLDFFFLQ